MASVRASKRGGRYCVAGGPNKTSCTNTSYTEGVSMHYFPSDENVKQAWVKFVRRHRKDFIPSKSSSLCSVHFEDSCFERRAAVLSGESEIKFKRFLIKGSVPTRDTVVPYSSPESKRKRRKVSPLFYSFAVHDGTLRTSSQFRQSVPCVILIFTTLIFLLLDLKFNLSFYTMDFAMNT